MSDKINISHCSNSIAKALHAALRAKRISKVGIDEVRAAIVGYFAGLISIDDIDFNQLEKRTLRRTVEKVG